ncbi:LuxR C-terminal-related transcriptional regulator [Microbacterium sp. 22242]
MATRSIELWFTVDPDELAQMIADLPPNELNRSAEAALAARLVAPEAMRDLVLPATERREELPPHLRRWMVLVDGWQARLSGDLELAYDILSGLPAIIEADRTLIDPTHGVRGLYLNQAALTAALLGRFQEALSLYQRVLRVRPALELTFLAREAHIRSALIHGMYGTRDAARAHLVEARALRRSVSWVEPLLDVEQNLAEALLDEDPVAGFERALQLSYGHMGEFWPFHLLILHRTSVIAERRVDSRERIEALQSAGIGAGSSGLPGSVTHALLALDSLLSGNVPRAREELQGVDAANWPTRVVRDLVQIASSSPRSAIADLNAAATLTKGLRQADRHRLLLRALAEFLSGEPTAVQAAVEHLSDLHRQSGAHEVAVLRTLSPRLLGRLAEHVPGLVPPGKELPPSGVLDDPRLTAHELDVLAGLARGETREQIASSLFRSVNTVKSHQRSLYRKLGVGSRHDAVIRATVLGYL